MSAPSPIRILIADDHFVVREGLRVVLERQPDFVVVGEAVHGADAVKAFRELQPDVTVMDLRMPVLSGLHAIREIRSSAPAARILVLSTLDGDEDIHAALAAGALGYLLKQSSGEQIVPAIRALHAGQPWTAEDVRLRLAAREENPPISPREQEILELLARGEANKQIADVLKITEHTVKSHLKHILDKLQVPDRTAAVTVALRRGIIHL